MNYAKKKKALIEKHAIENKQDRGRPPRNPVSLPNECETIIERKPWFIIYNVYF